MPCGCGYGCPASPVSRDWLYTGSFDTRYCTGYTNVYGFMMGNYPSQTSFTYDSSFLTVCDGWANALNTYMNPIGTVDFIGSLGTIACKAGQHPIGKAFDFSTVQFTNGQRMDSNWSWSPAAGITNNRRYLAAYCITRMYATTVLTYYYSLANGETDHYSHIHFDTEYSPVATINPPSRPSDRLLCKAICNLQGGTNFAYDFTWTWDHITAILAVKNTMGMGCLDPFNNIWHMWTFLATVAQQASWGYQAYYVAGYC